jgi:phosphohistidine phosphatase SixA
MKRFLLAALLVPAASVAQVADTAAAANPILDSLKTGGYVIVFRHAHTDRSKMEQQGWSLADRSTQRNLSERGAEESHTIGHAFKALGIPVGEVLASPMFRTRETAEHAFGRADTTELLRSRGSAPGARELLTRPTATGMNRILVTHNAYLHRHFGPSGHGEIGEGDAVVARPKGDGGFEVLGRIRLSDWARTLPGSNSSDQRTIAAAK